MHEAHVFKDPEWLSASWSGTAGAIVEMNNAWR